MVKENEQLITAIADCFRQKKLIDAREKKLREELTAACEKYNVLGFENDLMSATYIPKHEQERFDTKAFQEDHEDLAALYMKTTNVKASVQVRLKK